MKLYVVSIASSNEYGCSVQTPQICKTKKEALHTLSLEYKDAVASFSECESVDKTKKPMYFEVADYDNHSDSVCGKISVIEL